MKAKVYSINRPSVWWRCVRLRKERERRTDSAHHSRAYQSIACGFIRVRVLRSNLFFRTMTSKRIGGKYSAISSDSLTPCLTAEMSGPQRVSNKQTHEEQMFRGMGSPQAYLQ